MIAAWMLYALVVSGLVAGAAAALDRLLRPYRTPLRWIWGAALLLGAVGPVVGPVGLPSKVAAGPGTPAWSVPLVSLEALTVRVGAGSVLHRLDAFLVAIWVVLTLALLAAGLRALHRLSRLEGRWTPARVRETPVLLAGETGPAVVGLVAPRIVLPGWLLAEGEERRLELAVLHEREHVEARDPALLAAAFLVVAVVPWNPVLWWSFFRLRRAVEVDCDRRVLRHRPGELRDYAETLLEVSGRGTGLRVSPVALAEPRSLLERRIRTMTSTSPKHPVARFAALGTLAALSLAAACLAPEPGSEAGSETPVEVTDDEGPTGVRAAADIAEEPVHTPFTYKPDIKNRREVVRAMEEEYPSLLEQAGIGGRIMVWFLIDREGAIEEVQLKESSGHEALDQAALRVARVFDFTPARNEGEPVPVWIALPITFVAE